MRLRMSNHQAESRVLGVRYPHMERSSCDPKIAGWDDGFEQTLSKQLAFAEIQELLCKVEGERWFDTEC